MNICYKYPIIYWNTACLIVDADAFEDADDNQGSKMSKISVAIADMQKSGIQVALPDINTAEYGFAPDTRNNQVMYSLKAISGAGDDVARAILQNRPFESKNDFYHKMIDTKLITPAKMIQLIKAGCFDKLYPRKLMMKDYLLRYQFSQAKKLTMVHVSKMKELGMFEGTDMEMYARVPAFVKYVTQDCNVVSNITQNGTKRKLPKCGYYDRILKLNSISQPFFEQCYTHDSIVGVSGEYYQIEEKKFLKESKKYQEALAEWMNQPDVIEHFNSAMFNKEYGELMSASLSEWEMDALGYYYSGHELADVQTELYGVMDFFSMPEEPEAYDHYCRYINGEQKWMPKYKIVRIMGTVVGSDNDKHLVTLLTPTGIVNVKFSKGHYVFYNQKISELTESGKKQSIEASWFKRGTKLIISGYRSDFNFRAYRYADTIYTHIVSKIDRVLPDGTLELKVERASNKSGF